MCSLRTFPVFLADRGILAPRIKRRSLIKVPVIFKPKLPMARICTSITNGLALSKLRPFCATFFIFSDFLRPAIRLASLMELPSIFVFSHDAMGDGEDGPTHQPV